MKNKSIMVVAGEISGDTHAARLINQIHQRDPDIKVFGIGGDMMANEGVELFYHTREMAVLGFTEVIARYSFFKRGLNEMVAVAKKRQPAGILLVDYPGFNLRLAKILKKAGFKVVFYISPQVWAWNTGRIPKMAKSLDRLLAIFPFEPELFRESGLKADFVGHPLVERIDNFLENHTNTTNTDSKQIALLPGSRIHEIKRILPVIWKAAGIIEKTMPDVNFVIAAASKEIKGMI
ncbi:MAG: lipid-A-disaccharide synthase, partial [Lentisphaerae bacterium]|nr:lipid-A-disaccharide synthase [Lentisphaerota bacterium]